MAGPTVSTTRCELPCCGRGLDAQLSAHAHARTHAHAHPPSPLTDASPLLVVHTHTRADFHPLVDSITYSDYYLLANDFVDYVETQERVDAAYRDTARWAQMSIMSTAGSGFFSSDRTIAEVWLCVCVEGEGRDPEVCGYGQAAGAGLLGKVEGADKERVPP